ncbi:MAG: diaminopimelate decarboxylase [Deltaproteobacteria bacterium]|nr:diaminopimelate decarboxylase [Deltaproteobacteria bacterium]
MHYFNYHDSTLFCEEVALPKIAHDFQTPTYVYSQKTIERHFKAYQAGFGNQDHLISYSVKANSNLSILKLLAQLGSGFDIVSQGELFRIIKAGIPTDRVVFSGVGKTEDEMKYALQHNILSFNVESESELLRLNKVAGELYQKARVSLRVNPDIHPQTHPYISTGLKENKFGIPIAEAYGLFEKHAALPHIDWVGIDCHIGSQMLSLDPILETAQALKKMIRFLETKRIHIQHVNLGGGLGIAYHGEEPPSPEQYLKNILECLSPLRLKVIVEPGRTIVGNAGILLTRVLYLKKMPEKNFVIVDAAMNDLIRPTLYQAHHEIWPVVQTTQKPLNVDVVGPICESGDFLAKSRKLACAEGDLLAILSAGAYGFSMASNYNARPRAAEVLVSGMIPHLIRPRESLEDLIRGEL